jgi:hypothetical protein
MARTIDVLADLALKEDTVELYRPGYDVSAQSVTQWNPGSVITLAAAAANVQVPFPIGLVTATILMIQVSSATYITFSKDGTSTHHRINAGGVALCVGNFTSLYLTNGSGAVAASVEVTIGG